MRIFPSLHDDELVISGLMRLHFSLGSRSIASTLRNMKLKRELAFKLPAMPGFLEQLSGALPDNHPQKALETLVKNHTIGPFAVFFSNANLTEVGRQGRNSGGYLQKMLGTVLLQAERIRSREAAFCRKCVELDRAQFGCAIWHRNHQIPGVAYCWRCATELEWECKFCRSLSSFIFSFHEPFICSDPAHSRNLVTAYYRGPPVDLKRYCREAVSICNREDRFQCGLWRDAVPSALYSIGCRSGKRLNPYAIQELLRSKFSDDFLHSFRLLSSTRENDPTDLSPALKDLKRNTSPAQQLCIALAIRESLRGFEQDFLQEAPGKVPGSAVWVPHWRDHVCLAFANGTPIHEISEIEELPVSVVRSELIALGLLAKKQFKSETLSLALREILNGMALGEAAFQFKISVPLLLAQLRNLHPKRFLAIQNRYVKQRREQYRALVLG